jgi:hypothetical protein
MKRNEQKKRINNHIALPNKRQRIKPLENSGKNTTIKFTNIIGLSDTMFTYLHRKKSSLYKKIYMILQETIKNLRISFIGCPKNQERNETLGNTDYLYDLLVTQDQLNILKKFIVDKEIPKLASKQKELLCAMGFTLHDKLPDKMVNQIFTGDDGAPELDSSHANAIKKGQQIIQLWKNDINLYKKRATMRMLYSTKTNRVFIPKQFEVLIETCKDCGRNFSRFLEKFEDHTAGPTRENGSPSKGEDYMSKKMDMALVNLVALIRGYITRDNYTGVEALPLLDLEVSDKDFRPPLTVIEIECWQRDSQKIPTPNGYNALFCEWAKEALLDDETYHSATVYEAFNKDLEEKGIEPFPSDRCFRPVCKHIEYICDKWFLKHKRDSN